MPDDITDARLEAKIQAALDAATIARDKGDRAKAAQHYYEFERLIRQRSPAQVRKMEKKRGLT